MKKPIQKHEIKAIFKQAFNGRPNILTPNVIRYGRRNGLLYELSWGSGILTEEKIFGVTFLGPNGERTKLSQGGFTSEEAADRYIFSIDSRSFFDQQQEERHHDSSIAK